MLCKMKATVWELQELCGYLNFLNRAIYPGRVLSCHMYVQYSGIVKIDHMKQPSHVNIQEQNTMEGNKFKLKQYHHVRLNQEFKSDCCVWLQFLTYEGQGKNMVINRPMIDSLQSTSSHEIFFYSVASAAKNLGFGCILGNRWIYGQWGSEFMEYHNPSIEYLELFTLCAGILTWEHYEKLKNTRITIFCDNMGVVTWSIKPHLNANIACICSESSYSTVSLTTIKFSSNM